MLANIKNHVNETLKLKILGWQTWALWAAIKQGWKKLGFSSSDYVVVGNAIINYYMIMNWTGQNYAN